MRRVRIKHPTLLLLGILFCGLGLLAYPTFSDYWNARHQSRVITNYTENVEDAKKEIYESLWAEADSYNSQLAQKSNQWKLSEEEQTVYEECLKVDSSSIMAYIEIPVIECLLPVYHGSEEAVLQVGVGHIEGSSLPVGGESTHCVLVGHRGLESSKLFTDLDLLVEGDRFLIHTLDRTLTYEVDQICVTEPSDFTNLVIEEGKDYCTLVTCTPYGINTHRLLIRGHRVGNKNAVSDGKITAEATQIDPMVTAPFFALPILLLWLCYLFIDLSKLRFFSLMTSQKDVMSEGMDL